MSNLEKPQDVIPYREIVLMVKKFIRRIRRALTRLHIVIAISLLAGISLLYWTFLQRENWKDDGDAIGSLMALTGVFFGTICLSLVRDALSKYQQKDLATDLHDELQDLANRPAPGEKFEKSLHNAITKIFK